jgi:hypothetical protein
VTSPGPSAEKKRRTRLGLFVFGTADIRGFVQQGESRT